MNFVFHLFVSVFPTSSYFNVEDFAAASLAFSMLQIILKRFAVRDFSGQFYWSPSARCCPLRGENLLGDGSCPAAIAADVVAKGAMAA